MRLTEFFRLRMPDGTDPVNIEDFNDNFEVIDRELKKRISDDGSASDVTVGFEVAESRQPLKSGEKLSVLMGKAHRFFTDLKTVAFSGKYGDLIERPTLGGAAGYKVADNDTTNSSEFLSTARVAYEHGQEIDALSRDFAGGQMEIRLTEAGKGEYRKKGADTWLPFSDKSFTVLSLCTRQGFFRAGHLTEYDDGKVNDTIVSDSDITGTLIKVVSDVLDARYRYRLYANNNCKVSVNGESFHNVKKNELISTVYGHGIEVVFEIIVAYE